ncbi:C-type mannose receptor 2 [Holothuria leucospilota]|uniref:C-type mannose receptor 2 n=1 Tax=Holothuria leucospilota TaxID=206669 RepID=A0A9Q1BVZ9_HOLLE|nr:C-type mannose receptor 2 [Holothuria leucospilota]
MLTAATMSMLLFLVAFFSICEGKICYLTHKRDGNGCWKWVTDWDVKECDVTRLGGYTPTSSDNSEEDPCRSRTCTDEYNHVCSNLGETYGNPCEFELAKLCDNPSLEINHNSEECAPKKDMTIGEPQDTFNQISPVAYSAQVCPPGYTSFNTSCYKFTNDTVLSRSASRSACEADSAHLVFINSEEESDFVGRHTSADASYWIGLNGRRGHFYWDNGSKLLIWRFLSFIGTEISALNDVNNCIVYIQKGSIIWRDEPCLKRFGYICEYEDSSPTFQCPGDRYYCPDGTTQVNPSHLLEMVTFPDLNTSTLSYFDGYRYLPRLHSVNLTSGNHHFVQLANDGGWCSVMINTECVNWTEWSGNSYLYVETPLTWHAAAEACLFYGGHLVYVQTQEENYFLKSLSESSHNFWIGLSDLEEEGVWRWLDTTTANYSNWSQHEPNNWQTVQHCAISNMADGQWDDIRCNDEYNFVCELELY